MRRNVRRERIDFFMGEGKGGGVLEEKNGNQGHMRAISYGLVFVARFLAFILMVN